MVNWDVFSSRRKRLEEYERLRKEVESDIDLLKKLGEEDISESLFRRLCFISLIDNDDISITVGINDLKKLKDEIEGSTLLVKDGILSKGIDRKQFREEYERLKNEVESGTDILMSNGETSRANYFRMRISEISNSATSYSSKFEDLCTGIGALKSLKKELQHEGVLRDNLSEERARLLGEFSRLADAKGVTNRRYSDNTLSKKKYGSPQIYQKIFNKNEVADIETEINKADAASIRTGIDKLESRVARGPDGTLRRMRPDEIEATYVDKKKYRREYFERAAESATPAVLPQFKREFQGLDKDKKDVNKQLEDIDKKHKESWDKEREKRAKKVKHLLELKKYDEKLIDDLTLRLNEAPKSDKWRIETEIRKVNADLTSIREQLEELGVDAASDLDEMSSLDKISSHLDENVFKKDKYESEHLKTRRELEKKHGLGKGGFHEGSSGGFISGLNSWLGLSDESGIGVIINFLSWPAAYLIASGGIVGPVLDTFGFFIPFINILRYPIYLIGTIILHPFIKAILHPFKEDFYSLFEHEEGYFSKKRGKERKEETVKEAKKEAEEELDEIEKEEKEAEES